MLQIPSYAIKRISLLRGLNWPCLLFLFQISGLHVDICCSETEISMWISAVMKWSSYTDQMSAQHHILTVSDSFILMVILLTASEALLIILRMPAPLRVWVLTALGSWKHTQHNGSLTFWAQPYQVQERNVINMLITLSLHVFIDPHLLSLRTLAHLDLVIMMGETRFSEDTCTDIKEMRHKRGRAQQWKHLHLPLQSRSSPLHKLHRRGVVHPHLHFGHSCWFTRE